MNPGENAAALEVAPATATPAHDAIAVEHLEKTYPNGTKAVRDVSFRVRRGEIFGILGPNGAGKTTTIGVLGTLVRPTGGRAFVDGLDVRTNSLEVRRRIGFAMQEAGVDLLASGREFLLLQARLYGLTREQARQRAATLLRLFELEAAADKLIGSYSGGMKRRIDLAASLIHVPRILFLDEPSEGLDPRSRFALWTSLKRLNQRLGTTILLSTHYMEEADRLCNRIAIIDQGRIVAQDTPAGLKASVGGQSIVLEYAANGAGTLDRVDKAVREAGLATNTQRSGTELHVYVSDAAEAAPRLLRVLDRARLAPSSLRIQQPTLDDAYLKLTGRRLEATEKPPEAKA